jgi:hypothetical protein
MKMTLSTSHAADLLKQDEYASWTYAGARALVEHLENIEDETGTEIDFCPVAIRCDYSQWDSLRDWAEDYFGHNMPYMQAIGCEDDADDDEVDDAIREYIQDNGTLIEFDGGVIVSSF